MKRILVILGLALVSLALSAQNPAQGSGPGRAGANRGPGPGAGRAQQTSYITLKLWPEGAPDSNGLEGGEREMFGGRIGNITDPELLVFPAKKPNGQAVIMCPGGGYNYVAAKHEGTDMAEWFNSLGITFAVLKYRMPNGHCDIPLNDAHRAIVLMREHAAEWGFTKLGIMGGSAGGHLASSAAVHYTPETRPDFQILIYPVITFQGRAVPGRRMLLFGETSTQEQIDFYSNELHVTSDTPPAFLAHSYDDPTVPVTESAMYFTTLVKNGVPAVLHTYPEGGHGWGFQDTFRFKREWTAELEKWLATLEY